MTEKRDVTALSLGEFFPDGDLVLWVGDHYGPILAEKVSDLFRADPKGERGFTRAVRRSITHEIEESMHRG